MKAEFRLITCIFVFIFSTGCLAQIDPAREYPEIFEAVQRSRIFKDQKTFPDCQPLFPPDTIKKHYEDQKSRNDFRLELFVKSHFSEKLSDTSTVFHHIDHLWNFLTKPPTNQNPSSSLISLPYPYFVPGGRFREVYYWDSYFAMLGMEVLGKYDTIEKMIDNFAYLIDQYGYIPNGNRTYYLSRSQPPFFSFMVTLLAKNKGNSIYQKYLPQLEREYHYWMSGEDKLDNEKTCHQKVVLVENNGILNRYWDGLNEPRPESFLHDELVYQESKADSTIFRDIRSAAESGWDFSSRWFRDFTSIRTIHTTEVIPVDLNCLLYHLEFTLHNAFDSKGDHKTARDYLRKAEERRQLILKYCWNADSGYFYDYDFITRQQLLNGSLAGIYPLYLKLADHNMAERVLAALELKFLYDGGLVTTTISTGEQWDYPNGWAPLQWIAYRACKNYGYDELAHEIAVRWTNLNLKVFFETGKMLEKYNVINVNLEGGGGEYELQDGFGWTNGVFLKLWHEERNEKYLK